MAVHGLRMRPMRPPHWPLFDNLGLRGRALLGTWRDMTCLLRMEHRLGGLGCVVSALSLPYPLPVVWSASPALALEWNRAVILQAELKIRHVSLPVQL